MYIYVLWHVWINKLNGLNILNRPTNKKWNNEWREEETGQMKEQIKDHMKEQNKNRETKRWTDAHMYNVNQKNKNHPWTKVKQFLISVSWSHVLFNCRCFLLLIIVIILVSYANDFINTLCLWIKKYDWVHSPTDLVHKYTLDFFNKFY